MQRALAAVLASGGLVTCIPSAPSASLPYPPACPRSATVDETGRCSCSRDQAVLLGACVEPGVFDAFCGPAAGGKPSTDACVFRSCAGTEALDIDGDCLPAAAILRSGPPCRPPSALIVTGGGHTACVPPDVACPRGTFAERDACQAPASCPAGALWNGRTCRPVVTRGARGPIVDLGAWAELVLGATGGPGAPVLCRPLESAPSVFGLSPRDRAQVHLSIAISVPDQDVSRVFASVKATSAEGRSLPPSADALAAKAVSTLIEPLRSLGGESSTAEATAEVLCTISSL